MLATHGDAVHVDLQRRSARRSALPPPCIDPMLRRTRDVDAMPVSYSLSEAVLEVTLDGQFTVAEALPPSSRGSRQSPPMGSLVS